MCAVIATKTKMATETQVRDYVRACVDLTRAPSYKLKKRYFGELYNRGEQKIQW